MTGKLNIILGQSVILITKFFMEKQSSSRRHISLCMHRYSIKFSTFSKKERKLVFNIYDVVTFNHDYKSIIKVTYCSVSVFLFL